MMTLHVCAACMIRHAELHLSPNAEHIMGMPALSNRHWTAADVRALIREDQHWPRYELLDGELLVTPSPGKPHQLAASGLHGLLWAFCNSEPVGVALMSPADIELAPESIMQPDVFVVSREQLTGPDAEGWTDVRWLMLAVEVLSPSSQQQDRVRKRDFYLANGVREYWIVDTNARVIERWLPDRERPEIIREELVWNPLGATQPFVLDVQAFFEKHVLLRPRA